MRSQLVFILQILAISAIVSALIKYGLPADLLTGNLAPSSKNAIAAIAISLPVVIFAIVLWQRK